MNYFLRFFVTLILFFIVVPAGNVRAVGEFQADYDVQYAISPTGKTIVTQHVVLTNKLSNYYPQKYSLLLDSDKISNVIAYDDGGVISPSISVQSGKTELTLGFNKKAVGLGKSLTFSLRYEHADIATKNGSIWEIYVPGIVNDPDVGSYAVSLSVPSSFGEVAYLSPFPGNNNKWSKDQMIRGGISAAYGKSQRYAVDLTYTLQNAKRVANKQTIALPPETAYQSVRIISLDPKPLTVSKDADGNWLAEFLVPALQSIVVKTKLDIAVFLNPSSSFTTTEINRETNLSQQPYWQVSDEKIKEYAGLYKTPREIYNFVVRTLSYDYSRINDEIKRLGALGILAAPDSALCMEFTDLFIAIARAGNIPARRILGYAYTTNSKLRPLSLVTDVLHAWPEYYDNERKNWIPIDPTWANTTGGLNYFDKLDFNHIVFAIQGESSEMPYPAGFYHDAATDTKDVLVEFSETAPTINSSSLETKILFSSQVTAGKKVSGTLTVHNNSGSTIKNVSVRASSTIGNIQVDRDFIELLPYGTLYLPLEATFPRTFTPVKATIQATANDATILYEVTIHPPYALIAGIVLVIISVVLLCAIFVWILLWKTGKKK